MAVYGTDFVLVCRESIMIRRLLFVAVVDLVRFVYALTVIVILLNSFLCIFQIYQPVFYVAIDHQRQSVVVAVRGTLSLNVRAYSVLLRF